MVSKKTKIAAAVLLLALVVGSIAFYRLQPTPTPPTPQYSSYPSPIFRGVFVGQAINGLSMLPIPNAVIRVFEGGCPTWLQPEVPVWVGLTDISGNFKTETSLQITGYPCYQLEKAEYYTTTAPAQITQIADQQFRFVAVAVKRSANWNATLLDFNMKPVTGHVNIPSNITTLTFIITNNQPYSSLGGSLNSGDHLAVTVISNNMSVLGPQQQFFNDPFLGPTFTIRTLYNVPGSQALPSTTISFLVNVHENTANMQIALWEITNSTPRLLTVQHVTFYISNMGV